jgi:hypothetical protein
MRYAVLLLSCISGLCHATPPQWPTWPQLQAHAERFAYDQIDGGRRLLLGPHAPRPVTPPTHQSCAALYAQRVALMRTQVDYKPSYTDDPRNRGALFIGTIFPPAFYFLAFSGIQAYGDATHGADTREQLTALSYASAAQQCYVR